MCGLFDKALELASTEEQQAHVRKGSIQILYLTYSSVRNRDAETNEYLFNLIKEAGISNISEGRSFPDEVKFTAAPSTW
jgi:predicted HAD superfamily Cof-like phosphohydrolase